MRIDLIQQRQSGLRTATDFGMRNRAPQRRRLMSTSSLADHRTWPMTAQSVGPVRPRIGVHRLNRRLYLESPQARMSRQRREDRSALSIDRASHVR